MAILCLQNRKVIPIMFCRRSKSFISLSFSARPLYCDAALHTRGNFSVALGLITGWCVTYNCSSFSVSSRSLVSTCRTWLLSKSTCIVVPYRCHRSEPFCSRRSKEQLHTGWKKIVGDLFVVQPTETNFLPTTWLLFFQKISCPLLLSSRDRPLTLQQDA